MSIIELKKMEKISETIGFNCCPFLKHFFLYRGRILTNILPIKENNQNRKKTDKTQEHKQKEDVITIQNTNLNNSCSQLSMTSKREVLGQWYGFSDFRRADRSGDTLH